MPGFESIMGMFGGGGGGGGGGIADSNPYSKAIKAAGVQMETTGRGFASLNPKISGAISGAYAGEHAAYQRMAHQDYQQALQDAAHLKLGNDMQRGKGLSTGAGPVSINPEAQL